MLIRHFRVHGQKYAFKIFPFLLAKLFHFFFVAKNEKKVYNDFSLTIIIRSIIQAH